MILVMAQFVSQFVSSSNMFLSDSKMNSAERISGYLGESETV